MIRSRPDATLAETRDALKAASAEMNRWGLTGSRDDGRSMPDMCKWCIIWSSSVTGSPHRTWTLRLSSSA